MTTWHVVRVPSDVQLPWVEKEWMTQGWIYCVVEVDMQAPCWISKSLPAILAAINRGLCKEKRLHASSMYRLLRGETRSKMHNNHLLSTYKRKDVDQLNEHMRKFPSSRRMWRAGKRDEMTAKKAPGRTGPWADPRRGPSG